jgi:hypothetical protein
MKNQALILILFLTLFAGKVAGQCTPDISPGSSSICYNTSPGTFTATGHGGSGYTYLWYKDGGSTAITTQTYDPGVLTKHRHFIVK